MNFELNDDEKMLMDAIESLCIRHGQPPLHHTESWFYGETMADELNNSGFTNIAREEGFGPLHAALLVEHTARQASVIEVAASALVAPQLLNEVLQGPIALVDARDGILNKPVRFLPMAKTAIIDLGDDVAVLALEDGSVEAIDSFLAFPFGRLSTIDLSNARRLGADAVPRLRQWWHTAIALEISGCMHGALDRTVAYVKERRAFNREIGAFQAVQHRLAYCAQMAHSTRWLALRAADSQSPADAAVAASYAQEMAEIVYYDTHQFTGAIGLTFEYPLHYWTLRMKVLQTELGGEMQQSHDAASKLWP
jgi:hypothetical protein